MVDHPDILLQLPAAILTRSQILLDRSAKTEDEPLKLRLFVLTCVQLDTAGLQRYTFYDR